MEEDGKEDREACYVKLITIYKSGALWVTAAEEICQFDS